MRKIITIIACAISFYGFSQETIEIKTDSINVISRFDAQLRWNQFNIRLDQTILNSKYPYQLLARFRYEFIDGARLKKTEFFLGKTYPLDNIQNTFFGISIGVEYEYAQDAWNPLARAFLRSRFDWGLLRINYGSNWINNHGVTSSLMFNVTTSDFRLGIMTNDKFIGPRTEVRFKIGKDLEKQKTIRFHLGYLLKEDRIDVGVLLRFGEWFPKQQKKLKKILDSANPF